MNLSGKKDPGAKDDQAETALPAKDGSHDPRKLISPKYEDDEIRQSDRKPRGATSRKDDIPMERGFTGNPRVDEQQHTHADR